MPNAVMELQNIGHRTFATKTAHSQLRCNTQNCNVHIIKININVATGFFFASGKMHTFPVLFSSEVCVVRGFFSLVPPCIFSLSFSPYLNLSMAFTHLHNIENIQLQSKRSKRNCYSSISCVRLVFFSCRLDRIRNSN